MAERQGPGETRRSLAMPLWITGLAALIALAALRLAVAGECAGARGDPVLDLQMARKLADVEAMLRDARCVRAQSRALWIDLLAFIPGYTAFLALLAAALRPADWFPARALIALLLLAAAIDVIEDALQLALLRQGLGTGDWLFDGLAWTARPKWVLLAIYALIVLPQLARRLVKRLG